MVVAGEIETKKRGKREMGEDVVVVVVVGVAVVGAGFVAVWVGNMGQGGSGMRGLKVERES